jgi:hypothetical protein
MVSGRRRIVVRGVGRGAGFAMVHLVGMSQAIERVAAMAEG